MLQYAYTTGLDHNEPMMFVAEEQNWDELTLKQLKEEYNIIFMTNGRGVMPIMVVNKNSKNPLFVIGHEDDGRIYFKREFGQFCDCFSYCWVKPLISDIKEALKFCEETLKK